jgi:hypothetical protein
MEAATAGQRTPEDASSAPITETYRYSVSSNPTLEDQLFELVRLSEVPMSKQLFDVVMELLRLNIPPSAVLHVMKTLRTQATQSTMPPSLQSSRPHSPPPTSSSQSSSTASRSQGETAASKQTQRRSSASKSSASSEGDKSSRKHRHPSSSHKSSSSRSAEKLRGSVKGGSDKSKGQTQDTARKVG